MFFSETVVSHKICFLSNICPEHAFSKTDLKNLFQGAELKSEPGLERKEKEVNWLMGKSENVYFQVSDVYYTPAIIKTV